MKSLINFNHSIHQKQSYNWALIVKYRTCPLTVICHFEIPGCLLVFGYW